MATEVTPGLVLRRFLLWLLICSVSAAPSFTIADGVKANRAGMAAGVLFFVFGYTWWTCTPRFQGFYERRGIRSTLRFGYGLRLLLSGAITLQFFSNGGPAPFAFPDVFCGMGSALVGSLLLGKSYEAATQSFHGAFLITCIQGALLNAVIFIVMVFYYLVRGYADEPRTEERCHGFEVLTPTATTVEPTRPLDQ